MYLAWLGSLIAFQQCMIRIARVYETCGTVIWVAVEFLDFQHIVQGVRIYLFPSANAIKMLPLTSVRRYCALHFIMKSRASSHRGKGILLPNANATHPPIKQSPPNGVTGPNALNLCGSSTRRYMLPLNIVIPATSKLAARVFFGATEVARRRTPE